MSAAASEIDAATSNRPNEMLNKNHIPHLQALPEIRPSSEQEREQALASNEQVRKQAPLATSRSKNKRRKQQAERNKAGKGAADMQQPHPTPHRCPKALGRQKNKRPLATSR